MKSIYYDLLRTDLYIKYLRQPSILREEILALDKEKLVYPIIIDEIQKVPELLNEVHWLIENTESYFILCGSNSKKMKYCGINLLGGRVVKYNFYPLVYPEIRKDFDLLKIFNNGLIPSHFLSNNPRKLLKAYIDDYLTREIQVEGLVKNISAFSRFIDSAAFANGKLVNYSNIARDCFIDPKTVKEYYNILVDTLVGYFIYPYQKKISREIISSTPKFYLFDTGIVNRITQSQFKSSKSQGADGALEHYIFTELKSYIVLNDLDHKIDYWRTKTGLSVDFIVNTISSRPIPIEVKISSNLHKTELRSIKTFMEEHKVDKGYIVCLERNLKKVSFAKQEIEILPVQYFLEKLWNYEIFI